MVSCSVDDHGHFLALTCVQHVKPKDIEMCRRTIRDQMQHLRPGFALLVDLTHVESIDAGCAEVFGAMIELCSSREMGLAVWVIPDPGKDIGLNLISRFHSWTPLRTHTRPNLAEALRVLMLDCPAAKAAKRG